MKNGIFLLEFMTFESLVEDDVHEFLFIFTPLRIKGGDGLAGTPNSHPLVVDWRRARAQLGEDLIVAEARAGLEGHQLFVGTSRSSSWNQF